MPAGGASRLSSTSFRLENPILSNRPLLGDEAIFKQQNSMNHETIAIRVENISMATGIIAGLSAAGAVLAEPSGWDAIGVWLGLADEPWIIKAAPVFGTLATVSGTVSGFTYFYARWQKKRIRNRPQADNSASPEPIRADDAE